jgi:hypothetical protein
VRRFHEPELTANPDRSFVRDASNKLVRRGYWTDMPGANLTNDGKRAHLIDLKREHVINQVCPQRNLGAGEVT